MTSDELQKQLNETWMRDQSADDAHDAIWGEPFDGYTVRLAEYEKLREPASNVRRLRGNGGR